jgi:hypothetical protein
MKNLMAMATAVLLTASTVFGGSATFVATSPGSDTVLLNSGTPATLDVTVATASLPNIDSVDLVIGWNRTQDLTFAYSAAFVAAMTTYLQNPPYDESLYPAGYTNSMYMSGAKNGGIGATSILVGTLTLQTTGLALGDYPVTVSYATDTTSQLAYQGTNDSLNGTGTIHVVPEPASLMLLGLSAAAGLRRRRA